MKENHPSTIQYAEYQVGKKEKEVLSIDDIKKKLKDISSSIDKNNSIPMNQKKSKKFDSSKDFLIDFL